MIEKNNFDVDVLVICYNHQSFIKDALDSIKRQRTSLNFRIVICDDASSDNTINIVRQWATENPQIPLLILPEQDRLGITLNYYRGLTQCSSPFIAVLEGDDLWIAGDKLERQVGLLVNNPHLSMASTRVLVANLNSREAYIHPLFGTEDFESEVSGELLAMDNILGTFSSCVYRKGLVSSLPIELFEMKSYDWAINLAMSEFGPIGFLPIVGTLYRQHSSSTWSRQSELNQNLELEKLIPQYIQLFGNRLEHQLSSKLKSIRQRSRDISQSAKVNSINQLTQNNQDQYENTDLGEFQIPWQSTTDIKISVLLTSYNRSQFIGKSIESVLMQTFQNFELIIVDDNSVDNSWEVICSFNSEKIRAFKLPENIGAASALNVALQESRGELIAVINCDDTWELDKLSRQLSVMEENPELGAVFTSAKFIDEKGMLIPSVDLPDWFTIFSQPNRSQAQWLRYFFDLGNALCHPSVLIKKSFYIENGLYNNNYRQLPDFERWIALVKWSKIQILGDYESVNFRLLTTVDNASAETPENRTRGAREHMSILEKIFFQVDEDILVEAFSQDFLNSNFTGQNLLQYELALLCIRSVSPIAQMHQELGIRLLEKLLEDPESKEILKIQYGVTSLQLQQYRTFSKMNELEFNFPSKSLLPASVLSTRQLAGIIYRRIRNTPYKRIFNRTYHHIFGFKSKRFIE